MLKTTISTQGYKETFMSKDIFRQIANLLSVLLGLTINVLAVTLPLNG